jgi:hypothetical protein
LKDDGVSLSHKQIVRNHPNSFQRRGIERISDMAKNRGSEPQKQITVL